MGRPEKRGMGKSEFDTKFTRSLVCPYCGHECKDSWELSGDSGEHECGKCERSYWWERRVDVTYCCKPLEPRIPDAAGRREG